MVVAELLRTNPDLELIDAREYIPNFKARPGLTSWLVLDDTFVPGRKTKRKTGFPVGDNTGADEGGIAEGGEVPDEATKVDEEGETIEGSSAEPPREGDDKPSLFGLARCLDMGMKQYFSHDEVPENHRQRIRKCVFPPTAEEVEWMHLGMLVYNCIQFVCVLTCGLTS